MKAKKRLILFSVLAGIIILIAIFAPVLTPYDPNIQNLSDSLTPPSKKYILGTDRYGRDMLSRVIIGARCSVFSALLLVSITTILGTVVGVICGCFGGAIDVFLMRISDIFFAFPGIVLALGVAGVLGGGIYSAVAALAVISWPKYARIVRGKTMELQKSTFVQAARLGGLGTVKIIIRHIMPNILGIISVTAMLDIGTMLMEIAGLSFLGLGAIPPTAEWGSMMSNGRSLIQTNPWVILSPGIAIFITVSIFNLLGDSIRDYFDTRKKSGGLL